MKLSQQKSKVRNNINISSLMEFLEGFRSGQHFLIKFDQHDTHIVAAQLFRWISTQILVQKLL